MTEARREHRQRGFTLAELACAVFLLGVMAGIALPVAHVVERRTKELELRQTLRKMRRAIDTYNFVVKSVPSAQQNATAENWPEELEDLVEGVDLGLAKEVRVRFLRRIPRDPLTGEAEWGIRSNKQESDDDSWDNVNVFDVYSLAEGKALDGTEYSTW